MENCAVVLAFGGERSPSSARILFRPSLAWAVECARGAGIADVCVAADFSVEGLGVCARSVVCEDADSAVTAARDFLQAHAGARTAVLRGDMPLLESGTLARAMGGSRSLTALRGGGGGGEAYCFDTGVLLSAADEEGFSLAGTVRRLELSGEAEEIILTGDEGLTASAAESLALLNLRARMGVLERLMRSGVSIPCTDGVMISPEASVAPGTVIMPMTVIRGGTTVGSGCVIGANTVVEDCVVGDGVRLDNTQCFASEIRAGAQIGPFVRVRPGSVIGENVRIGNFVEVKNSTIGEGTSLSHLSYVGDADVGSGVNFGCGFATANYNGSEKFRTTVGDGAFIGCDNTLVAPVSVGDGAYTAAGSVITDDVPAGALAVARTRQTVKERWAEDKGLYKKK